MAMFKEGRPDAYNYILVVDDDPINNYLTAKLLTRMKVSSAIKSALNTEEAFRILDGQPGSFPHLIILDINMPGMDGYDFLNAFNERYPLSKVIFAILTTSNEQSDIEKMKAYGIKYFIKKPLSQEKVESLLEDISTTTKMELKVY